MITFLGVPQIRIIIFVGSKLGDPFLGKLPYGGYIRVEGLAGFRVCVLAGGGHLRTITAISFLGSRQNLWPPQQKARGITAEQKKRPYC